MEMSQVGTCKVDVGVERVRSVQGRGALVPLDAIFLLGRDVVGVAVGRPADGDGDVYVRKSQFLGLGFDGVSPPASGHRRQLAGRDDDDELTGAEHLYVDDVRSPGVRGVDGTDVEQDRFRPLTSPLLFGRGVEEAAHDPPERVGVGAARVVLLEVEPTGPVGGAGSERVAQGGVARRDGRAVGEREGEVRVVHEGMQALDGRTSDGDAIVVHLVLLAAKGQAAARPADRRSTASTASTASADAAARSRCRPAATGHPLLSDPGRFSGQVTKIDLSSESSPRSIGRPRTASCRSRNRTRFRCRRP